MLLDEYFNRIRPLDRLDEIQAIRFGLFGEVGSVLSTAKKRSREGKDYDFASAVLEELGDTAWYFFRLVDRLGFSVADVIDHTTDSNNTPVYVATNIPSNPVSQAIPLERGEFPVIASALGDAAAKLLEGGGPHSNQKGLLQDFFRSYTRLMRETGMGFAEVLRVNLEKTEGRFVLPDFDLLPTFDDRFDDDERLPADFEISVIQRANGKTYLKWHDVFIGDPLTDNIEKEDGYRFHDVFHMAYAAILHWSPTFRALIRHKRKSDPKCDEEQDSGRAIVIEEGLSAWIFSLAKNARFFADRTRLPFDVLKGVQQFVSGYEVEKCPLSLWEKAILDGYCVFRELTECKSGVIIGNRKSRSITFTRG